MTGILGSGFGLYGYLPAIIINTNEKVMLLRKSYDVFKKRPELQFCEDRIVWSEDEVTLLAGVETIIISLPPKAQMEVAGTLNSFKNIQRVVLEKPLAPGPDEAISLLAKLDELPARSVRIGYIFRFTDWYSTLNETIKYANLIDDEILIDWQFKAHHYRNDLKNWKRYNSTGGAVIRFYGIHLIALVVHLGYTRVEFSKSEGISNDDIYTWTASFTGDQKPTMHVFINSNSDKTCFNVDVETNHVITGSNCIRLKDPFGGSSNLGEVDRRADVLARFLNSFDDEQAQSVWNGYYSNVNLLWKDVEKLNRNSQS